MRESVALRDVIADARPGFACGEIDPNGVVQIRMNNVSTDGALVMDSLRRVPRDAADLSRFEVGTGDVLFNATNSPELVGKSALFRGYPEHVVYSNHFIRLRPVASRLDSGYLSRWLQMRWRRGEFSRMCRQWVNQASVASERLLSLEIPLPPLPEQRRIAAILDKADELRAKRRAALEQLNGLTQAMFLEMFGDIATNDRRWTKTALSELITVPLRNGLSPSHSGRVEANVLTLSAITGAAFDGLARKNATFVIEPPSGQRVRTRDFLICRGNGNIALVGKGHFPNADMPDVVFPDTIIAAEVDEQRVLPSFLEMVWNAPAVRAQIERLARTTNGTFKVNQGMLEGIQLPVPPMSLQRQFASRKERIDAMAQMLVRSSADMSALFNSLQQRAFAGDL